VEKQKIYSSGYKSDRDYMIALQTAKQNVDMFFAEPRRPQQQEREHKRSYSYER